MTIVSLIASVMLVFTNAFFVAVEFAAVGARRSEVDARAESGNSADRAAQRLQQTLLVTLGSAQLGITMASLALGRIGEPVVGHLLELLFDDVGLAESLSNTLGFVLGLSIVVFVHTVVGEMVPKNFTIVDAGRMLRIVAIPMLAIVWIARPVVLSLVALSNGFLRLIRVEPVSELDGSVTSAELASMVRDSAEEGLLDAEDSDLLSGAIAFGATTVEAVMVPLDGVDAVPITATVAETEARLVDTAHLRLIVYESDISNIRGFVHAKDLLSLTEPSRHRPLPQSVIRPMVRVAPSASLPEVLLVMRRRQTHLGVVAESSDAGGPVVIHGVITLDAVLARLAPLSR